MRLYHGTNLDIDEINLEKCRPYKDFGTGFYLTKFEEQARKMAVRVSKIYGGNPIVNVYEVPDDYLNRTEFSIKDFGTIPTPEWALFVSNNRSKKFTDFDSPSCNFDNKYEIVSGPIADDDMALLFRQFENNLISFESLTEGLTFKEETHQVSFHTKRALEIIKKVGVL